MGGRRGESRVPRGARGGAAHGSQPVHVRGERGTVTETARRLRRLGAPHARARAAAVLLGGAGAAAACAAAGLGLAPRLAAVLGAWLAIAAVAAVAVWLAGRAVRGTAPPRLGVLVERAAGTRAGSIVALVTPPARAGVSEDLLALADARAARVVLAARPAVRRGLASETRRRLAAGAGCAVLGAALFAAAAPAPGRAAFWHPLRALGLASAPLELSVDRTAVRRGDSVTVAIGAPAATQATLWTRGPGEPWRASAVTLDSAGRASRRLGPLTADLYLRAASGRRRSVERKVTVAPLAFLADLQLTARFPAYLVRPD